MFRFGVGIFIILHGLVHLWYLTLSQGWVPFEPEMGWTGRSWLLSPTLGNGATRALAGILYPAAALLFVAAGAGFLARAGWSRPLLLAAALFSSALILLFWEGGLAMWMEKGLIGVLVNLLLVAALWALPFPSVTG